MSILSDVKGSLGITSANTDFDSVLITYINSVFPTLGQLGIGPEEGFMITGDDDDWEDFYGSDLRYNNIQSYMYLRVRLLFDPPQIGFVIAAQERQVEQLEWRINMQREVDLANG